MIWQEDAPYWRQKEVWANSGYNVTGLDAGAVSFARYGRKFGTAHTSGYRPQVGDAIVYNMNAGGTSAQHVAS